MAGLFDEARPFLCSALCVVVPCRLFPLLPFFLLFSFFVFFFFSPPFFFLSLGACVCVCFFCSSLLFFSSLFSFSFLLPFLSWPSFFRSFLLLRSGGGVPLVCVGFCSPAILSFFFFWLLLFLLLGGTLVALASHSSPASARRTAVGCLSLFRQLPLAGLSLRLLCCLCQLRLAGLFCVFFFFCFFFLFLCFLLLLRLLPLAGLFCCFGRLLSLSFGLVAVVSEPFLGSMDLLPDVVLSAVSDSSDGSADQNCPAPLPPRLLLPVGKCRRLPSFTGTCYGDQVSWKGSSSTRIVSLQSGGAGRDLYLWGRHWGQSLTTLGADVGVIAETCIRGADHHALAIRGLWDAGFLALSHGCDADLPRGQDPAHYCLVQQMWAESWQCARIT